MCPKKLIFKDYHRENKCFQNYLMILTIYIDFCVFRAQSKHSQLTLITLPLVKWHHFRVQRLRHPIYHEMLKHGICKAVMEVSFLIPQITHPWSQNQSMRQPPTEVFLSRLSAWLTSYCLTHVERLTKSFLTHTCALIFPELQMETWEFPTKYWALFTWPTCQISI